jgi:hypothetical protein
LSSVYVSRIEDFLQILRQGVVVFAYSAQVKFPNSFENSEVCIYKTEGVHWLTEDMIMKFLPPSDKERMSYCCWYRGPMINGRAAFIFKDPSSLQAFFYFFSGLEEFMKKQPWGHLATS